LLLTARKTLALKPDKMTILDSALSLNKPFATAYYMKEGLRQLWSLDDKKNNIMAYGKVGYT